MRRGAGYTVEQRASRKRAFLAVIDALYPLLATDAVVIRESALSLTMQTLYLDAANALVRLGTRHGDRATAPSFGGTFYVVTITF